MRNSRSVFSKGDTEKCMVGGRERHVADAQIITASFREQPDAVISTVSDGTSKRDYLVIEALAKRVSSMQDI
jgi:hypothetical protein